MDTNHFLGLDIDAIIRLQYPFVHIQLQSVMVPLTILNVLQRRVHETAEPLVLVLKFLTSLPVHEVEGIVIAGFQNKIDGDRKSRFFLQYGPDNLSQWSTPSTSTSSRK